MNIRELIGYLISGITIVVLFACFLSIFALTQYILEIELSLYKEIGWVIFIAIASIKLGIGEL